MPYAAEECFKKAKEFGFEGDTKNCKNPSTGPSRRQPVLASSKSVIESYGLRRGKAAMAATRGHGRMIFITQPR